MKKTTILMILDGFGINENKEGNAIEMTPTPNIDRLKKEYPYVKGYASGLDVGLPDGQMGNSEVGHLNMGAGRIVYQELTRITKAINDGDFFTNEELMKAVENCKKNNSALHVFGLVSRGGVHSSLEHIFAVFELAKRNGLEKVYMHAFLDGRDTPPTSAKGFLTELENEMAKIGVGKIATISGRYYAMDRDKNYDRVEKAYAAIAYGEGRTAGSMAECMDRTYAEGVNDEFVIPTVILDGDKPTATVNDGDSIIFANFRPDRAREITRSFCDDDFPYFERRKGHIKVTYVCFTEYDLTIENKLVAFKPQVLKNTLGEYISSLDLVQARIAETEKYAHVTFFFNGGVEAPNPNENRYLVPSPKVATYDLQPEMSAPKVTETLIENITSGKNDLIIINYANPDMVGHTGVIEAAKKAVAYIDECVGKVVEAVVETGSQMFICADHGNIEQMVNYETGDPFTAHTTNPVPFILVNRPKAKGLKEGGRLADIAPTLLDMMDIKKPEEMTGESLLIK